MNHKKILLIASGVLIIGLSGIALAQAATAVVSVNQTINTAQTVQNGQYYVFVRPDSYYKIQGSSVRFTGRHFTPGEKVTVATDGSVLGNVDVNQSGNFTTRLIGLPYGTGNRTYTFTGSSSRIPFAVHVTVGSNKPWIILNTYYAGAGTPITVSGHQFGGNEPVSVWFNGISAGMAQTDANGNFTLSTSVPNTGAGRWTISAAGKSSGLIATQPFSQSF